jgi:hypothetical protein
MVTGRSPEMHSSNPYRSPTGNSADLPFPEMPRETRSVLWLLSLLAWPMVFALNLIVPLVLGASLIGGTAHWGLLVALCILLGIGWCICLLGPTSSARTVGGGLFVAISQLVPVLQLSAGAIAIRVTGAAGLVDVHWWESAPQIDSNLGSFVVTLVTGGLLFGASQVAGFLAQQLFRFARSDRAPGGCGDR